jgi:hypothetical protein
MFLPLALLFVGAVLVLNGLWITSHMGDREIVVINLVTAGILAFIAALGLVHAETVQEVRAVALTLLFGIIYLWVTANQLDESDGRGLGWFSLIVAISVLPEGVRVLPNADTFMQVWLGIFWFVWAALCAPHLLLLAQKRIIKSQVAFGTLGFGVLTGWLPALVFLNGVQL